MQFSKTIVVSVLVSAGLFASAAHALSPTPNPTATAPSYPAWDSASTYTAGQRVTHNGATYEAQWWTKGDSPATAGEWGAWKQVTVVATPTPTATPTATPTPFTQRVDTITDYSPSSCTNGPKGWQLNRQYAVGDVAAPISGPFNTTLVVFRALTAHLSTGTNQPRYNMASDPQLTSVSYDPNLWQALKYNIPSCPPPTPTPSAVPTPTVTPTATPVVGSAPAWSSTTVYTAGQRVTYNGQLYEAKWYTTSENPSASGEWGVWKKVTLVATPTPSAKPNLAPEISMSDWFSYMPFMGPIKAQITATAKDSDGSIAQVEFFKNGVSFAIVKSAPYAATTSCVESPKFDTITAIATDNLGAKTTSNAASCRMIPEVAPTPTPSATPTATPSTTPAVTPTTTPGSPQRTSSMSVPTWKDDATAAYSMMHDDLCAWITDGQIDFAAPALKQRGLVASFGMITGSCGDKHWTAAKQFIVDGNEIFSHSRGHTDANSATWDAAAQISGSSDDIAAHLDGYRPSFFAWPSDIAADAPMSYLRSAAGFMGGRAANRVDANGMVVYDGHGSGVNASTVADPFQVKDDMFTLTAQWSPYEAQVKAGGDLLNLHVDAAIANGGWANRTMHGVNDASWNSVPLAQYIAHLDYIKTKVDAGLLWVATPSNILKYSKARSACKPTLIEPSQGFSQGIVFASNDAECVKFATPITLHIGGNVTSATQAGKELPKQPAKNNAGGFLITVDPLAGGVGFNHQFGKF